MTAPKIKIVVVGGGTGTYTLLRGLRHYVDEVAISVIVTMADSGGSTGRLRDEFGQLPVGDARQALAALAADGSETPHLLRDLFLYRFKTGEGLVGHNFGNLFLTALTDILGSEALAIEAAGDLLRVCGEVIPVTTDPIHLSARFASGRVVVGEHEIDEPPREHSLDRIIELSVTPAATITKEAANALAAADYIIFGPGDFYTSILANVVVDGFVEAVKQGRATKIFVANLMARPGQTIGMHLGDYIGEIERYLKIKPDIVLLPDAPLPPELLSHYALEEGVHPVDFSHVPTDVHVLRAPIISHSIATKAAGDVITRSLIRHDSRALAHAIVDLLHSKAPVSQ